MPNLQDGQNELDERQKTPTELANIQMDREFYGDDEDEEFDLLDADSAALRNRNQS